jgi:hypothetical protein
MTAEQKQAVIDARTPKEEKSNDKRTVEAIEMEDTAEESGKDPKKVKFSGLGDTMTRK